MGKFCGKGRLLLCQFALVSGAIFGGSPSWGGNPAVAQNPDADSAASAPLESDSTLATAARPAKPNEPGRPINFGYMIIDGKYVPLPYVVHVQGEEVTVDHIAFPSDDIVHALAQREGMRNRGSAVNNLQSQLESLLLHDGLIVRFEDGTVATFGADNSYYVLGILLSSRTMDEKLRSLMTDGPQNFTSNQWGSLIESYTPNKELEQRVAAYFTPPPEKTAGSPPAARGSGYVLVVLGMMLTVLSFGVVLGYRPQGPLRWRELNKSNEAVQLVVRCTLLIGVLSGFDLLCTVLADQTVGFWEMNPWGGTLLQQPLLLSGFKLATTMVSMVILLKLRLYRGAQVASWWLCLVLTLLTIRWVAVHSLLMT